MPSFQKLGQRPTHKERAQPLERQKLGLLEKHKDYSLRAKDFNKKKAYLKTLRQKAADRNEDEFYHKMLSRRGPGGALTRGAKGRNFTGAVDGDRGNRALPVDAVRILKTQDLGYVRTVRSVLAKEVRQLEEKAAVAASFAKLGGAEDEEEDNEEEGEDDDDDDSGPRPSKRRKPSRVVFSADTHERDLAMGEGDDLEDADEGFEGFGGDGGDDSKGSNPEAHIKAERATKLRRKLRAAKQRLKALADAEDQLEIQRIRMAKKATTGAITKSGKKVKIRERKR
ncbi:hypothetical protein GGTG_07796 [Gaeumannomyces tritici R3-111a-1]|uniref:Uncharacterized protein n=1 Tax=Gaeumannomyces tritici (strain R3-111a-1) TaxID=644352 RepID=J3P2Q1_GAET3|nr:hypothetical protein GGTG_07796 [Gaeumannomyces tritici R3-111a-1]EJT73943.1 hypothetical protein GGTG_07796 [Gaeumannomyces tritici R3-111a-1]